jgi:hypothetical protein
MAATSGTISPTAVALMTGAQSGVLTTLVQHARFEISSTSVLWRATADSTLTARRDYRFVRMISSAN